MVEGKLVSCQEGCEASRIHSFIWAGGSTKCSSSSISLKVGRDDSAPCRVVQFSIEKVPVSMDMPTDLSA